MTVFLVFKGMTFPRTGPFVVFTTNSASKAETNETEANNKLIVPRAIAMV